MKKMIKLFSPKIDKKEITAATNTLESRNWASGAGNDSFFDQTDNFAWVDNIIFDDLNASDLTFTQNNDDLIITNTLTSETLTVIDQFASTVYNIENFSFIIFHLVNAWFVRE